MGLLLCCTYFVILNILISKIMKRSGFNISNVSLYDTDLGVVYRLNYLCTVHFSSSSFVMQGSLKYLLIVLLGPLCKLPCLLTLSCFSFMFVILCYLNKYKVNIFRCSPYCIAHALVSAFGFLVIYDVDSTVSGGSE